MATEREALVALNLVPEMGPIAWRKLLGVFGSAAAVLAATEDDLRDRAGFGAQRAAALAEAMRGADPTRELSLAAKTGIKIIAKCDPEYPSILKKIADPPLVLYCFGDLDAFTVPAAAIVGTRIPTVYGSETAHRFAYAVAAAGYCVVSGMARGIDTSSHKGALDAKGRTIGVLGGAIDCFYPSENRELGRTVAKSRGLIVSEFPLGRKPDRTTFPMRNRIISGLSRLTLVVEAAAKSGSLITAGQAMEQGRTVMAIPGRIDVPSSLGCNLLIKDGAAMALSPNDLLDEMDSLGLQTDNAVQAATATQRAARATQSPPQKPFVPLTDEENRIYEAIGAEETLIDEVIRHSGVDAGRANALLLSLQLKRLAEILPGGWVKKKRK
jgi:DNA processing protein